MYHPGTDPSCGIVYDTAGDPLCIGDRALVCILPRGHQGPHDCRHLASIIIANTGPTTPRAQSPALASDYAREVGPCQGQKNR